MLLVAVALTCTAAGSVAHAATCDFPPVKQQIDIIIDTDATRGAEFRRQFKEGTESIAAIVSLVTAEWAEKIDNCRFDVAEYLTKRGFPPPH